jgi:hypothetical protein
MAVAAGDTIVDIVGKMKLSGHESRGHSERTQRRNH